MRGEALRTKVEARMRVFEGVTDHSGACGVIAEPPAMMLGSSLTLDGLGSNARRVISLPADAPLRLIDIVLTALLLIFLLPVMLLIAAAVRIEGAGPVFFGHQRIGRNGASFRCLKFRTMVPDAERRLQELLAIDPAARREWVKDHKLREDPRVTRIGRFLRRSSLDELPQLLNVLKGEMSLVGPRPIVPAEVVRYGRYYADYTSVRPGISGLWQISGRNDVCYRKRIALDVIYARRRSVSLYLAVVFRTPVCILLSRGCY